MQAVSGGSLTLNLNQTGAATYSGVSTAGGALINAAGTQVLTGSNTYTGGTTISGGVLQLGNGLSNGSVAGNILDNTLLALNNGSVQTFAGAITGSGGVSEIGAATLWLTASNGFTGGTTISAGDARVGQRQRPARQHCHR